MQQSCDPCEPAPSVSLRMIAGLGLASAARIVDIGGGASGLACALNAAGYRDITIADRSLRAMEPAQRCLGERASDVRMLEIDIRSDTLPGGYDLWHDHAVLRGLDSDGDVSAYVQALRRTVNPGGYTILATPAGGAGGRGFHLGSLLHHLGSEFVPVSSRLANHPAAGGGGDRFLYLLARKRRVAEPA